MIQRLRRAQRHLLEQIVRTNPNLGLEERAELFTKLFENHLESASRILDIGGGWGFYHQPLTSRGHEVTVMDVVKPGIQKSPLVIYDGTDIPFPDKSFDVSMFITVLHHIPQLEKVVEEARRVTRKKLIVVEDTYHHAPGRAWTVLRDMIYNIEFIGHPCNFKKKSEWIDYFSRKGFRLSWEKDLYTWLTGMRILNSVLIFDLDDRS